MPLTLKTKRTRPAQTKLPAHMTEDQFVSWIMAQEFIRAEWIDGEVQYMSPVSFNHVDINSFVTGLLKIYCEENDLGVVVGPEFMIRLVGKSKRRRVPDTLFVAKNRVELIQKNHLEGPPDLIVEIVSPDDPARDYRAKFIDYQAGGVREYWIIDPLVRKFEAHILGGDGKYKPLPETEGRINSKVAKGFFLKRDWLFQLKLPTMMSVLGELGVR